MQDHSTLLLRFRPSPAAFIAAMFERGGDEAIGEIASADGGWGLSETTELLRGLRELGEFPRHLDSQDVENLQLASLGCRQWRLGRILRAPAPDLFVPTLASAILVRASGDTASVGIDLFGIEGRVALVAAAALALPAPSARQAASLFAWRLAAPMDPQYGTRCFLWLAILVIAAGDRSLGCAGADLAALARQTLATDAGEPQRDGLHLRFRVDGRRWTELLSFAKSRINVAESPELLALIDGIKERMGGSTD